MRESIDFQGRIVVDLVDDEIAFAAHERGLGPAPTPTSELVHADDLENEEEVALGYDIIEAADELLATILPVAQDQAVCFQLLEDELVHNDEAVAAIVFLTAFSGSLPLNPGKQSSRRLKSVNAYV